MILLNETATATNWELVLVCIRIVLALLIVYLAVRGKLRSWMLR